MRNNVLILLTLGMMGLYIGTGVGQLLKARSVAHTQAAACEGMQSCVRGSITQVDGNKCHIAVGNAEAFYPLSEASERLQDCREQNK